MLERVFGALLELHRHQPTLHRVLFRGGSTTTPAARSARTRLRAHQRCARKLPRLSFRGHGHSVSLAVQLVIQSLESITHGLVIHPRAEIAPDAYVREAAAMLERYLTGAPPACE
jgi:tetracycline repressor-like protein